MAMRRVSILGATGSIGDSALDVVARQHAGIVQRDREVERRLTTERR